MEPNLWRPLNDNELGAAQHARLRRYRLGGRLSRGGHLRPVEPARVSLGANGSVSVRCLSSVTDDAHLTFSSEVTVRSTGSVHVSASVSTRSTQLLEQGVDKAQAVADGSGVRLRSVPRDGHCTYLDVEASSVRARWDDPGAWQLLTLRIESGDAAAGECRQLRYGDTISLASHNGRYLEAAGGSIVAKALAQGEYGRETPTPAQLFTVERSGGVRADPRVLEGDEVRLKCRGSTLRSRYVAAGEFASQVTAAPAPFLWSVRLGEPPPPLRVGVICALARPSATRVRWYGRGPFESYPDRHAGARLGHWAGNVADQTFRYVRPQESGNKLHTRWMALSDADERYALS